MSPHCVVVYVARSVLLAGAITVAVGPNVLRAQGVTQNPEARARTLVESMAGGQYAQAFDMFTPQMKAALPIDRLSATWSTLVAQAQSSPFAV